MSLITHRCTNCGHPDYWRLAKSGNKEICECGCRCTPGEPELAQTFGLDGQPIERVIKPGDKLTQGVPTHACAACKAKYDELTGAAA